MSILPLPLSLSPPVPAAVTVIAVAVAVAVVCPAPIAVPTAAAVTVGLARRRLHGNRRGRLNRLEVVWEEWTVVVEGWRSESDGCQSKDASGSECECM